MSRPARSAVVAIYRVRFPSVPDWAEGPLPLAYGAIRADVAGRSTYYPPRTARLLYGTPGHQRRWHKNTQVRAGSAMILGVEAIRIDDRPGAHGLLMIHFLPDDVVSTVRALAGRDRSTVDDFAPAALFSEFDISSAPPFTITFVTPGSRRLPRLYSHPRYLRWPVMDQWLWSLASRTNQADHPPDPDDLKQHAENRIRMSADWCGMTLRDGMAFVGTRPDRRERDPFYNHAALYVRSLYLDAAVLGLLQLEGITELEESLAVALDESPAEVMDDLEKQLTAFRHQLWWQHLSAHGTPNLILSAFHRQHRLPERFDQVLAEINDYNRLSREADSRKINNSVVLFTLFTVPVSIGLAALQVLGNFDPFLFSVIIVASLAFSLLLVLIRPARHRDR